jgi:hypothetical protein
MEPGLSSALRRRPSGRLAGEGIGGSGGGGQAESDRGASDQDFPDPGRNQDLGSFIEASLELWDYIGQWAGDSVRRLGAAGERGGEIQRMTRLLALSAALAAAVGLSACETPQQTNALAGGALGAGAGALIGSAVSGGSAGGALAGAAIGAGSGALIGSAATPQPGYYGGPPPRRCAQWAYDYNGNRVCTAFY